MNISQTYIAVAVNILVTVLPKFGITVGSEELTTTIQTIIALGTGLWILVRRYQAGGVTVMGSYK